MKDFNNIRTKEELVELCENYHIEYINGFNKRNRDNDIYYDKNTVSSLDCCLFDRLIIDENSLVKKKGGAVKIQNTKLKLLIEHIMSNMS